MNPAHASLESIHVRLATKADLPAIHALIHESFAAMAEHMGPGSEEGLAEGAREARNGDLSEASFEKEYLSKPETGFWVAVHDERGVIGCAGLKRLNEEDAELVRMSVSASLRGGRIGAKLVDTLLHHAEKSGARCVVLMTANPSAARFYARVGFASAGNESHTITDRGHEVTFKVFKMRRALT
jgi:N-acetylglutamate synthase-like GNAT family acetyltransferase